MQTCPVVFATFFHIISGLLLARSGTIHINCVLSVLNTLHSVHSHGLSRRRDGSYHHEWDLLWARRLIRERHIRWQIWHSKLLVDGGLDLRRSHLDSNSWMRRISNFSTADLHEECQSALSIASAFNSEGATPQQFTVDVRQSLYHLYCPPGHLEPCTQ